MNIRPEALTAIVLFSHGSVLCGAGEALSAHAARLRVRGIASIVEVGYLNYSEPPFLQAVESAVKRGATRIVVLPYFLVPGKFVKVDLPQAIRAARTEFPDVEFVVADAIGFDERLASALIESAQSAVGPQSWREDLHRAAASCHANPDCPLYNTPACQAKGHVEIGESGDRTIEAESSSPLSLLVMVHGSPRPIANEEMYRVVEIVKQRDIYPIVQVGFMECNTPTIPDAVESCVAQGARTILAVPYFLHTGAHVADDLPTLLDEERAQWPGIAFRMGRYLGCSERLTDLLASRATSLI